MKNKVTLLIQTIGMYVMHLPLYVTLIIINLNLDADLQESITNGLFIAALVLMILMIPVCIINVVVSIISSFKGKDSTKETMVMKLSLIPWYALNFVIGFVFVSIFFNPFMMVAIPVIIALLVSSTYILMLSTSIADIAYCVYNVIKKKWDVSPSLIFSVILLFIFCLDVVGSIVLYKKSKKLAEGELAIASEEKEENVSNELN